MSTANERFETGQMQTFTEIIAKSSVISNLDFLLSHTHQNRLQPTAFLLRSYKHPSFDFEAVSLEHFSVVPSLRYLRPSFFICNPTTQQFREISFEKKICQRKFFGNLVVDPLESSHYKIMIFQCVE
ncbi:F-box protein [Gossypium australe]|uniref:F-box protein n=1 Tax=Gossypium australe TaxID=47621 RepID=A0A5B6VVH8_9ROSI|nr:F-box protein [Gossypium australe]